MKKFWMGLAASALLLSGCGANKVEVKKDTNAKPDWTDKGGVFNDDGNAVVYGVGIADNGPNISLMREKADSRARADLAVQLKVAVKKLTLDYMSDHKDYFDQKNTAGSDEMSTVVSKQVVDQTLIGSRIIDRWKDPETGALYSLAKLKVGDGVFDAYENALRKSLRNQHRLETEERMNNALGQLDKEITDQRQRENQIIGANDPAPKAGPSASK